MKTVEHAGRPHIHRVAAVRPRGKQFTKLSFCITAHLGYLQAITGARVNGDDGGAAGNGDYAHSVPFDAVKSGENFVKVNHLLNILNAQETALFEGSIKDPVFAGQGAGM
ncbi:MAG: hypothetical protein A4E56_01088 [Pelotomaculum sp. PtaU1.Bin065]|nr:MAG: hypothetical protein A4E56_01088 [Pelotomaculum sp. PtaU1.Bin065]